MAQSVKMTRTELKALMVEAIEEGQGKMIEALTGVRKEMEDMKESLDDTRAEIAIERRIRKEEKEEMDKRMLAMEDTFPGFGTNNDDGGIS